MTTKGGSDPTGKSELLLNQAERYTPQCWAGKLATQTATEWLDVTSLTPFRAISGLNDYGGDANDEALLIGSGDTSFRAGSTKRTINEILIVELSTDTPWKIRLVWGSGTLAAAIAAQQFTCQMMQNIVSGSKAGGVPLRIEMPKIDIGVDKMWMIAKNATDNATIDILIGIKEFTR
jgi:hypothetical protein